MCPVVVRNSNDEATWEGVVALHACITNHPPNPLPARKGAEKESWGDTPQSPLAEGLRPSALPARPVVARRTIDEAIWGGGAGQALSSATTNLPVVARRARRSNLGRRGRPGVVLQQPPIPCHSEPAYRRQAERRIHLQTHDPTPIRPPKQNPPHYPFARRFTPIRAW